MYLDTGHHLTYCTNIHPGESWPEVFHQLKTYFPPLKQKLSPDKRFGIGLRLSNQASEELLEGRQLQEFKQWLQEEDLYIFTMNGFPYGGFHHVAVKDNVHKPDWTTAERLDYTIRLAHILAELLPEDVVEGGISTSPLSYKPWLLEEEDAKVKSIYSKSTEHMVALVEQLLQLKEETGKFIHIDIEPEPDGLLENSKEVINYYREWLLPAAVAALAERGLEKEAAQHVVLQHIQLCYDVCHFALAYEKPAEAFAKLKHAGIRIGKIQLSAALKTDLPTDVETRGELAETLARFAESTYLHQVVERSDNGELTQYPDLTFALQHIRKPNAVEWRTHFHVPLFTQRYNGLESTQEDIIAVLQLLRQEQLTSHLEVETYTWDVLPEDMKKDLSESIRRELEWVLLTLKETENAENGRTGRSRTDTITSR
jgi:sugar phosphate isomerase/epimerase